MESAVQNVIAAGSRETPLVSNHLGGHVGKAMIHEGTGLLVSRGAAQNAGYHRLGHRGALHCRVIAGRTRSRGYDGRLFLGSRQVVKHRSAKSVDLCAVVDGGVHHRLRHPVSGSDLANGGNALALVFDGDPHSLISSGASLNGLLTRRGIFHDVIGHWVFLRFGRGRPVDFTRECLIRRTNPGPCVCRNSDEADFERCPPLYNPALVFILGLRLDNANLVQGIAN